MKKRIKEKAYSKKEYGELFFFEENKTKSLEKFKKWKTI